MGAATAYYLKQFDPGLDVVVVEKDPSYRQSSTVLSDGNVRIQFNLEENITMSLFAFEAIADFSDRMAVGDWRPEPAPRHQGNLFLFDESGAEAAAEGVRLQQSLGCPIELLTATQIISKYPAFSGSGYVGGTFGPRDGSVDPNAVLAGYVRRSIADGVRYLHTEVTRVLGSGDRVSGVELAGGEQITAGVVVNAAGPWCAPLLAPLGVEIPVEPVRRTVYSVASQVKAANLPSLFFPNGLYLLPESPGKFLVAWSQPDDPVGIDFDFSREKFYEVIWPELATTMPAFEALHLEGGWAGLYEVNTLDENGIIGAWPSIAGLFVANGFSGHGFQQCHAVGRHLAELITGRSPTLDLSRLGPQRILDRQPLYENAGRII